MREGTSPRDRAAAAADSLSATQEVFRLRMGLSGRWFKCCLLDQ